MPARRQTKGSRGTKVSTRKVRATSGRGLAVLSAGERARFTAVRQQLDVKLKPVTDAIKDSQCLTREDYVIRINARD